MSARRRRVAKGVAASAVTATPAAAPVEAGVRPERWSHTFVFVLAVAGSAVGFKTIWYFPNLASESGGGAFILIYLLLAFLVGAPLLIAQVMLGRRTHASPIKTFADLGTRVPGGRHWRLVGGLTVAAGFVVFSYLSVIAGWAMAYFVRALLGLLSGLTVDGMGNLFAVFVRDPEKQIFWHSLFTVCVGGIAARGVRHGLEPAVRLLAPGLYALLLVLCGYAVWVGGFEDAVRYLFAPDFSKLSVQAWLAAAAQVFFSLGLGTGVALMYGAYLKADGAIPRAALTIVGLDVLASVVAAIIVFAILFGGAVAPASGPSLVFQVLPLAFDHLPYGRWFVCLFFLLLVVISLLLGMALLEPVVVWLEERFAMKRVRAVILSAGGSWLLGFVTIFSFNYAAFSFKFFGIEKNLGVFDMLQTVTAELMLPLAGLLMAVFAGWMLKAETARDELAMRSPCTFAAWIWLLRLLAPPLLLVLLFTVYRL